MLEDKIKEWKNKIVKAEENGIHLDLATVKEIVKELEQVKKDYEELAEGTMV